MPRRSSQLSGSSGDFGRRLATVRLRLTSEGSLVRAQLRPPGRRVMGAEPHLLSMVRPRQAVSVCPSRTPGYPSKSCPLRRSARRFGTRNSCPDHRGTDPNYAGRVTQPRRTGHTGAPARTGLLQGSPGVLLFAGDLAAALAHPDTDAPLVGVGPLTGVPGHPAAYPGRPARFGRRSCVSWRVWAGWLDDPPGPVERGRHLLLPGVGF
jgi:hypothetical protein